MCLPYNTVDDFYLNNSVSSQGLNSNVDSADEWYDVNWTYRKQLNLSNPKNNYPIELNISYDITLDGGENVSCEEDCKNDFSDLRFTEGDGITLRDYYLLEKVNGDYVLILLNTSSENYMYMYFGNNGAISSSNPDGVYLLYDDFEDNSINTTKWEYGTNGSGGNVVETNGRLNISATYGLHGGGWLRSNSSYRTFSNNISIEKYAYYGDEHYKWFCLGTHDSVICDGTGDTTPPITNPSFMRLNNSYFWYHMRSGTNYHDIIEVNDSISTFIQFGTWNIFKDQWNNLTYIYLDNGTIEWKDEGIDTIGSISDTTYRDHRKDIFISQGGYDATRAGWIDIEYINVRRYCPDDEPYWSSFGNKEDYNNAPYNPGNPFPVNGSFNVDINVNLSWTGGDPDGDNVTYDVYFGNSSPPPIVVNNQTSTTHDPGTLEINETYYWKIKAWDENSAFSEGDIWWFSTSGNQPPLNPVILSAPLFGKPGVQLNFSVLTTDPDNDSVYYLWDWDNGSSSNWLGPYSSGINITVNHTWEETGDFNISVKAKDTNDAESDWSDSVQVIIENIPPKVKITKPKEAWVYFFNEELGRFVSNIIIGPVDIIVKASDNISGMDRVEFYVDDALRKRDFKEPYKWQWTEPRNIVFFYRVKVVAYDTVGNYESKGINVIRFF
jgi:hypothetical protein